MRLLYIDKLKAFAMLMVVWGHTMYFCIYHEHTDTFDPLLGTVCTFHVPLFFFLSGVVISSAPDIRKFLVKARRFMLPMFVVGFVNALLIGEVKNFFIDGGHNGYWYLLTLTLFYLLLVPFNRIGRTRRSFIIDALLALTIWIAARLATGIHPPAALNIGGVFQYWPYFVIGYICRKYSLLRFVTGRPWLTVALILAYVAMLLALTPQLSTATVPEASASGAPSSQPPPLILEYAIALMAIAALVSLFFHFSDNRTFIDRQLLLIGNSTLDIYIYHYFFIRFINLEFLKTQSLTVEAAVTATLTVTITYGSIAIGRAIDRIIQKT